MTYRPPPSESDLREVWKRLSFKHKLDCQTTSGIGFMRVEEKLERIGVGPYFTPVNAFEHFIEDWKKRTNKPMSCIIGD